MCREILPLIYNQHACAARITVLGLCVCVCLSDALFLGHCKLIHVYVEMKVPTALEQHRADFYRKGFSFKRFAQSYGVIRLL